MGEFYSDKDYEENDTTLPHGLTLKKMYRHLPGQGIHCVHLNQGTPRSMAQHVSNGVYQDGALFIQGSDQQAKAFKN